MQTTQTRTGRPRDAARHDAILRATQDLLADVGYDRLSIESVAAHCGVGKTTIYRRWPDKAALVADAVAVASTHLGPKIPDTGVLRDDMILFGAGWHSPDSRRDGIVAGLLTAMRHHPELQTAVDDALARPGQQAFRLMVQRAVERGDIPDPPDTDLIAEVLPAMVFHQITALNAPVDRDFIIAVIDHLVLPALRG
ncbi:TetR/AcrR family transcriptional regulator [Mycobacterium cookii]|uniref:TetR family transcriptional regulator n=1 Tax=Mycobacterium cookii TaxID=1775 RepID=A0A7I7KZH5_9MYCO|nr:TetR/AcrR family transcriptional regulator [Mycobacterium cookii]MCV7330603.1 TetR/AcrR family transcriptional regulator [Mycobacterium cookii]BBX47204.1 TetR family transcriptional regulator [Mycobacterium cookii]